MDLQPLDRSAERDALGAVLRDYLARNQGAMTWHALANELGVTGLAVPKEVGGAGGSVADVAVVVEELGRLLAPLPYLSTALVGIILGRSGAAPIIKDSLARICDGSLVGALAFHCDVMAADERIDGFVPHVIAGDTADIVLARADEHLYAARTADAEVKLEVPLDETRTLASLHFSGVLAQRLPVEAALAEDLFRVLIAAECVGAARHCLDATVEYLKTRVAFGRPIGSFQAIKHRCADIEVNLTAARATVDAALRAAQLSSPDLRLLAPLAAVYCSQAFWNAAAEMMQLLGGIAFTWDHETHRYVKRAKSTQLLLGRMTDMYSLIGERAGLSTSGDRRCTTLSQTTSQPERRKGNRTDERDD